MGRSIAKALRHRQLSTWKATDDERYAFYDGIQQLDLEVKQCMKAQERQAQ